MTTELPTDILLLNILPRLPAKSILRFKFVCKQWHSHLTTPSFAKIHVHHLTNNHHQNHYKLLVVSLSNSEPTKFCTIDCETPNKDPLTPIRLVPFEASYKTMYIVTSFHGMLCVGITNKRSQDEDEDDDVEYSHLILWNPILGEYKTLSKVGSDEECYKKNKKPFGLYYSSSDDDYKLLRVTKFDGAYIYSLKSDSWRKVVYKANYETWLDDWFSKCWEPTVLLNNEKLSFLKQTYDGNWVPNSYSILMFDTNTEKFTEISGPSFGDKRTTCLSFMVHGDPPQIHLLVNVHIGDPSICNENVELWRMDGDGDWTKLLSYHPMSWLMSFRHPMRCMRNGNWFMRSFYGGELVEFDIEKLTKDVVSPNINSGISIPQRGKYIETIVSPNQYTK